MRSFCGNRPATISPTVTAGFRWQPEMCPIAYAIVSTVSPNASDTPRSPIPTCGNAAESTAPRTPRTPARTSRRTPRQPASTKAWDLLSRSNDTNDDLRALITRRARRRGRNIARIPACARRIPRAPPSKLRGRGLTRPMGARSPDVEPTVPAPVPVPAPNPGLGKGTGTGTGTAWTIAHILAVRAVVILSKTPSRGPPGWTALSIPRPSPACPFPPPPHLARSGPDFASVGGWSP